MLLLQCSFSVCLRTPEESIKAVKRYVDEWIAKKQTPFRCYYDTASLDTVIVEKMYSTADVVHRSATVSQPCHQCYDLVSGRNCVILGTVLATIASASYGWCLRKRAAVKA